MLVQHKERDFLVAFGGSKKDASDQVRKSLGVLVLDDILVMKTVIIGF